MSPKIDSWLEGYVIVLPRRCIAINILKSAVKVYTFEAIWIPRKTFFIKNFVGYNLKLFSSKY